MTQEFKFTFQEMNILTNNTSAVLEHTSETGHIPIWSKVKFIDHDPH